LNQQNNHPEEKIAVEYLLMKIAIESDENAFKELFHHFFQPLCFFAYRYIPNKETCEDLVQDVFFKIWKNRKKIHIETSARNFLITTVRNNCIDYIRKRELEENYRLHHEKYIIEDDTSINNLYSFTELKNLIDNAIEKLPPTIKEVFILNRFEGLSYSQIASKYNVSLKSIEAYISKALKFLRTELKDYLTTAFIFLFFYF